MKRKLLYILLFILFSVSGFSQEVNLISRYEDNNVIFDATLNDYGTYTLVMSFTDLRGFKSTYGHQAIINLTSPSSHSIYKLIRIEGQSNPYYSYSYTYYRGKYNAKPDVDFPYLLPVKAKKRVGVSLFENIEAKLGKSVNDKILGATFRYTGIDTVYAIRSGQVVHIENSKRDEIKPEGGVVYYDKSSRTVLEVEHKDGTIARYVCITSGKSLLEPGDRIIAGQPVAFFTQDNDNQRMGIYIFHLGKDLKYKVFIPKFYTNNGLITLEYGREYIGAFTKEIVEKELTKKEKKSLNL